MQTKPVFERPDHSTFTTRMKTKIFQSIPSTWYGILISVLSLVMGQEIYDVELGEIDKFQKWVQAAGKTPDRKES